MSIVMKQIFCIAFVLDVFLPKCGAEVNAQSYLRKRYLNNVLPRNIKFIINEYKGIDLGQCSLFCLNRNPKCSGVFYHEVQQSCKLMEYQSGETVEFDAHEGWEFWSECEPGWLYFEEHCYFRGKEYLTWDDAKLQCKSQGGYLTEIESRKENEWIINYLAPAYCTHRLWLQCVVWIGANDQENDWRFVWDWSRRGLTFTNWRWREPNNYNREEHCVAVTYPWQEWIDLRCWERRPYVCEKKRPTGSI